MIGVKLDDIEIVFKDYLRIIPCSLNELCKVFNEPSKLTEYNQDFNNLNLFDDLDLLQEFISYGLQDSKSLNSAQLYNLENYGVYITTVVSIWLLTFKIFRLKYLDKEIPTLSSWY